jgi:DNA-binding transcriptional regulator YiaG
MLLNLPRNIWSGNINKKSKTIFNIAQFMKGFLTVKKDILPKNIRKIREAKLLSISEFARRAGLSPPVMRVEETGLGRMETK